MLHLVEEPIVVLPNGMRCLRNDIGFWFACWLEVFGGSLQKVSAQRIGSDGAHVNVSDGQNDIATFVYYMYTLRWRLETRCRIICANKFVWCFRQSKGIYDGRASPDMHADAFIKTKMGWKIATCRRVHVIFTADVAVLSATEILFAAAGNQQIIHRKL